MSVCIYPTHRPPCCDLVVCDGPKSVSAHRGIFNFNEKDYIVCRPHLLPLTITDIIGRLTEGSDCTVCNLHITTGWEGLFVVLLWEASDHSVRSVYLPLREAGMTRAEIEPFVEGPVSDIFPNLYYSKRFDILRRLCSMAKKKVENRFPQMVGKIVCHLVAQYEGVIAASSL